MGLREHNASSDAMHLVAGTTCNGCGFFLDALSVPGSADTADPGTAVFFPEREVVSGICQGVIHLPSDAAPETLPHKDLCRARRLARMVRPAIPCPCR